MIKNLRKKFIIVAMCSTILVLTIMMGIVNITNYIGIIDRADRMTSLLIENDGKLDEHLSADDRNKEDDNNQWNDPPKPDNISPETPFSTRYFIVRLSDNGQIQSSDLGKIAAISEENALQYAEKAFTKKSEKGFLNVYRYRMTKDNSGIMIVFLDCRQDLDNLKAFAFTSIVVSAIGLLAVFILVLIFSKIVFKPVEESYEKQKRFITDASHEIKTPLTIIDANTEVLEMENGENQWTSSIRNQIKRLTVLTNQLVTLSRLDEEKREIQMQEFLLSDVVKESIQSFEVPAKAKGKALSVNLQQGIRMEGNEKAVRQLIGILMDNSLKYSSDVGSIRITLNQKGRKIRLEVYNQVDNIKQGNLDILFERFYRMDASRNSETGGSGIGLSVAKGIVIAHKGKISAYSNDGRSITINIEFKGVPI